MRRATLTPLTTLLLLSLPGVAGTGALRAQTIPFGIHATVDLNVAAEADLDFGWLVREQGLTTVSLGDAGMGIISITGQADLDVLVTLDVPAALVNAQNPAQTIPFTFSAAYANRGRDHTADAVPFNGTTARFQIRRRDGGPPGPPPHPPHEGYEAPPETAYLYLYGTLNVGEVTAGEYTGMITVHVEYQ